ncbi:MAG TPA: pyruvate dehydrogenase complex dihydrolipoamide acetyltransferase [Hyphomicrobiaceae bacterium]|jgi:pyruvate dehydrogenase E2 component (dihydrolipoamide acetyltransferase)|nr:pyruvate dehydrogenase complex dihydrolipoamide acetyltransferase [Hyphomicrobiaceae bacterium]
MPTEILMPALSPTMEEGKLAKWLIKEGQAVKAGDVIAEIETDKATMEVEAVDEGKVGRLLVAEGTEGVKVNTPIAVLLDEGESAGAAPAPKPRPSPSAPSAAAAPRVAGAPTASTKGPAGIAPAGPAAAEGAVAARSAAPRTSAGDGRIFASPLARRLAKEAGLDLAVLAGSGPHGRIVKSDVEAAAKNGAAGRPKEGTAVMARPGTGPAVLPALPDQQVLALYEKGSYEVIAHDNMRRVIAQRLTLSKQTIPHFRLTVDCRIDELLKARERMNAASPKDGPRAYKLSVNDFVIKALALALAQVPAANVTWTEGGTLRHKYSDIGVAVAIEGGLFTPIIRHAELKSLSEISNEMRDLAERARKRRLAPHEYQGGTTSISNLGMYGIKSFDAVINPPHATILAVGSGEKRAVVAGDQVEVATLMSCTLSCDHRVVDGAVGAELINAFKALVEDPVRMLV